MKVPLEERGLGARHGKVSLLQLQLQLRHLGKGTGDIVNIKQAVSESGSDRNIYGSTTLVSTKNLLTKIHQLLRKPERNEIVLIMKCMVDVCVTNSYDKNRSAQKTNEIFYALIFANAASNGKEV